MRTVADAKAHVNVCVVRWLASLSLCLFLLYPVSLMMPLACAQAIFGTISVRDDLRLPCRLINVPSAFQQTVLSLCGRNRAVIFDTTCYTASAFFLPSWASYTGTSSLTTA